MAKARTILGLVGGVMLALSSAAHSLLGWRAQAGELAKTTAPGDLVLGLELGWQWGGAAMLVMGTIVLATFIKRWRGERVWMLPAALIAVGYLVFGAWALYHSHFDPFFFVFIIPGSLLAMAVTEG